MVKLRERVAFYPFFFLMALCQFVVEKVNEKRGKILSFFFFGQKKTSVSQSIRLVFMFSFDISQILKWFYFMSSLWLKLKPNVCVCENSKFYNLIFGGNVHLKRPNLYIGFMGIYVVQFGQVLWT